MTLRERRGTRSATGTSGPTPRPSPAPRRRRRVRGGSPRSSTSCAADRPDPPDQSIATCPGQGSERRLKGVILGRAASVLGCGLSAARRLSAALVDPGGRPMSRQMQRRVPGCPDATGMPPPLPGKSTAQRPVSRIIGARRGARRRVRGIAGPSPMPSPLPVGSRWWRSARPNLHRLCRGRPGATGQRVLA